MNFSNYPITADLPKVVDAQATEIHANSADVKITLPAEETGIKEYEVTLMSEGTPAGNCKIPQGGDNTCLVEGLQPGKEYHIKVATCGAACGEAAQFESFFTNQEGRFALTTSSYNITP